MRVVTHRFFVLFIRPSFSLQKISTEALLLLSQHKKTLAGRWLAHEPHTPHRYVPPLVPHSPTAPGRLCVPFAPRPPARLACTPLHRPTFPPLLLLLPLSTTPLLFFCPPHPIVVSHSPPLGQPQVAFACPSPPALQQG